MEFCRVNGTIPNDPYPDRPLRHPIYPYLMVFCKRGGICKRCATVDTFYSRRCDACEKFLDGESYTTRKVSKYGIFLVRIFPYSLQIREIRTRKTPYLDTFHAVLVSILSHENLPLYRKSEPLQAGSEEVG